jgi:hypothetical protein
VPGGTAPAEVIATNTGECRDRCSPRCFDASRLRRPKRPSDASLTMVVHGGQRFARWGQGSSRRPTVGSIQHHRPPPFKSDRPAAPSATFRFTRGRSATSSSSGGSAKHENGLSDWTCGGWQNEVTTPVEPVCRQICLVLPSQLWPGRDSRCGASFTNRGERSRRGGTRMPGRLTPSLTQVWPSEDLTVVLNGDQVSQYRIVATVAQSRGVAQPG